MHSLCCIYFMMSLLCENYANKWAWLYSNKILFVKTGSRTPFCPWAVIRWSLLYSHSSWPAFRVGLSRCDTKYTSPVYIPWVIRNLHGVCFHHQLSSCLFTMQIPCWKGKGHRNPSAILPKADSIWTRHILYLFLTSSQKDQK